MAIEGVQSTGNDFATPADFDLGAGQGAGVSQASSQGGLAAQLENLIRLLQQVVEALGGQQAPQQGGEEGGPGGAEQTGGPGKQGRGGCQNAGNEDQNDQVNKLVLQAIQLLVQALLGEQGSSFGGGDPATEATTSMV